MLEHQHQHRFCVCGSHEDYLARWWDSTSPPSDKILAFSTEYEHTKNLSYKTCGWRVYLGHKPSDPHNVTVQRVVGPEESSLEHDARHFVHSNGKRAMMYDKSNSVEENLLARGDFSDWRNTRRFGILDRGGDRETSVP